MTLRHHLTHLFNATRWSLQGLAAAWRNETAFRQEVVLSLVILPLALWWGGNGVERALLAGSWLLVLLAELVNSALEAVVNRFGPERHPLSGLAKDQGSASVFVALVICALTWGLIGWERWG